MINRLSNFQIHEPHTSLLTKNNQMKFMRNKLVNNNEKRIKEPLTQEERDIQHMREQFEESKKSSIVAGIDGKMKAGKPLTPDEIAYLKEEHPELYENWKKIEQERKALEEELNNAHSKKQVEEIKDRKVSEFASEVKSIGQSSMSKGQKMEAIEQVGRKMAAILDVYNKFTETDQYKKLPKETEEEKEIKNINNKNIDIDNYTLEEIVNISQAMSLRQATLNLSSIDMSV